jgi:hypothetical protein
MLRQSPEIGSWVGRLLQIAPRILRIAAAPFIAAYVLPQFQHSRNNLVRLGGNSDRSRATLFCLLISRQGCQINKADP